MAETTDNSSGSRLEALRENNPYLVSFFIDELRLNEDELCWYLDDTEHRNIASIEEVGDSYAELILSDDVVKRMLDKGVNLEKFGLPVLSRKLSALLADSNLGNNDFNEQTFLETTGGAKKKRVENIQAAVYGLATATVGGGLLTNFMDDSTNAGSVIASIGLVAGVVNYAVQKAMSVQTDYRVKKDLLDTPEVELISVLFDLQQSLKHRYAQKAEQMSEYYNEPLFEKVYLRKINDLASCAKKLAEKIKADIAEEEKREQMKRFVDANARHQADTLRDKRR